VCIEIKGKKLWLWRAVDDSGAVLDLLLQDRRDTQAAKTFLRRLLANYDVPEVINTDKLWSYGSAIRELPVFHSVEHIQVISTACCNNLIEQSHEPTRQQEWSQIGFKNQRRAQKFLALYARVSNPQQHTRTAVPAHLRRSNQDRAHLAWRHTAEVAVRTSDGHFSYSTPHQLNFQNPFDRSDVHQGLDRGA